MGKSMSGFVPRSKRLRCERDWHLKVRALAALFKSRERSSALVDPLPHLDALGQPLLRGEVTALDALGQPVLSPSPSPTSAAGGESQC
jgi:hypothetical protein